MVLSESEELLQCMCKGERLHWEQCDGDNVAYMRGIIW